MPAMTAELSAARISELVDELAPRSLYGQQLPLEAHNWGGRRASWSSDDMRAWQTAMAEQGLTAPTWPVEAGGAGWSDERAAMLRRELRSRRLPPPLVGIGLTMVGPAILRYGTQAQQQRFLPPTAAGEIRWCQGFSEPEAGSDLASLRTRAIPRGDSFLVEGQKIWTSHAHLSDWLIALVRTDPAAPKRQGITCLLIDMASPGVTTRPIRLISGASPFCETFLDGVVVPAENVLGTVDQGWEVARFVLAHERDMLGAIVVGSGKDEPLSAFAGRYSPTVERRLADPDLRRAVARSEIDARSYAFLAGGKAGRPAGPAVLKLCSSELNQDRLTLRQDIAGLAALAWSGPGPSEAELKLSRTWLRSRAYTIEGGTSEIMLNTIARQSLRLPADEQRP
jgi:alkylation response protein AidB-like acyl-CoA dehydrogenase